tara:strand:- start:596 stop:934 length:339 start_codon:yes stop_codon:yes gene_type:complete
MTYTGMFICAALTAIIALLVWYIKNLLTKLLFISENLGDLSIKLIEFSDHVETVYKMETYYGDTTLQNLLKHSKALSEELKTFEQIYSLTTEIEEEVNADGNWDDEEEYYAE